MEINNTLQEAVTSLINHSLQAFEKGASFLQEEIPQVVQQLLLWEAVQSFIPFILGVLLLFVIIFADITQWRYIKNKGLSLGNEETHVILFINVFVHFILLAGAGQLITNITWLKIWIAPKLFLIEYAAKLIK